MEKKEVKLNYPYSLKVCERDSEKLIGSEIKPKLLGVKEDTETWDNGPTNYTRIDRYEYWLVVQDGQPIIILCYMQYGDFPQLVDQWRAFHLEKTLQVDRWLPEE